LYSYTLFFCFSSCSFFFCPLAFLWVLSSSFSIGLPLTAAAAAAKMPPTRD
jgi:hypothetical protein